MRASGESGRRKVKVAFLLLPFSQIPSPSNSQHVKVPYLGVVCLNPLAVTVVLEERGSVSEGMLEPLGCQDFLQGGCGGLRLEMRMVERSSLCG